MEDFEYVVERKKPERICFGSSLPRNTDPLRGHEITQISPYTYDIKSGVFEFLNKVRSRKGVGSLVNGAPRFDNKILDQIPPSTKYFITMPWPPRKEGAAPFGSRTARKPLYESDIPGPGTYTIDESKCRRTRFDNNLGKPKLISAIEEVCLGRPVDTCSKCLTLCAGDYWQYNYTAFLCQMCMAEEQVLHENFSPKKLKKFQKLRNCGYQHQHEGTTAAIRLLTRKALRKKQRLENYLDVFIKCY